MTLLSRRLFAILALCLLPAFAQPAPDVPAPFERLVPPGFADGLLLVELQARDRDAPPWRMIEWRPGDAGTPARREKVSVREAIKAMYLYPGSDYFANVKIETSMPGMYEQDRALVIEALEHNVRRDRALVGAYLAANPEACAKVAARTPPGKDTIVFERETVNGIEVVGYTDNVLGLRGGTISQIHFFVTARETIVTAYLLNQKRTKFRDIDEFLRLRAAFIQGYTAYLAR
ncbi:hypothetical protein LK542_18780 [Massilia sp. IC2-477]|uniref:hypothetical protein n=1 Tax=Massilia sp. IC2-477 TaxID=2887198 RepID=UPI001D10B410|nr:hypothetical protein [Massilia sp. IC2-477]MCC2957667.1 hypothetical protein [Massilia sp. IC2-477]